MLLPTMRGILILFPSRVEVMIYLVHEPGQKTLAPGYAGRLPTVGTLTTFRQEVGESRPIPPRFIIL
jgi:hypothetical protein